MYQDKENNRQSTYNSPEVKKGGTGKNKSHAKLNSKGLFCVLRRFDAFGVCLPVWNTKTQNKGLFDIVGLFIFSCPAFLTLQSNCLYSRI